MLERFSLYSNMVSLPIRLEERTWKKDLVLYCLSSLVPFHGPAKSDIHDDDVDATFRIAVDNGYFTTLNTRIQYLDFDKIT